jgi:phosphoribosylformylglycinamidine (FGAM) synthase-like enzyme
MEQYDSMVGTANMSSNRPSDAGITNIKGTDKAIALTVDCNSRYVHADPEEGCAIAVAEAARNIVCSGGEPSAITNCLNFGNPYNPEVYWQFVGAIKGMKKSCERFKTPVTGGNVSFYNQTVSGGKEEAVFPTPTIGMLGLINNKKHITSLAFEKAGDLIYLVGLSRNDINCSEYLYAYHKVKFSPPPHFELEEEYALQQAIRTVIVEGLVVSAHDCADGGLFIALLEAAMPNEVGFKITADTAIRKDAFLFGEAQSRVVVSVRQENKASFEQQLSQLNTPFSHLGEVGGKEMTIDGDSFGMINTAKYDYDHALEQYLNN